jgi:hypothetical protein
MLEWCYNQRNKALKLEDVFGSGNQSVSGQCYPLSSVSCIHYQLSQYVYNSLMLSFFLCEMPKVNDKLCAHKVCSSTEIPCSVQKSSSKHLRRNVGSSKLLEMMDLIQKQTECIASSQSSFPMNKLLKRLDACDVSIQ